MNKIKTKITQTLTQPFLRQALNNFASNYLKSRTLSLVGLDFEKIQSEISAIKDNAINHLPELIGSFVRQSQQAGARVFYASTGREVVNYLNQLIALKNIRRIVKSKSMTSEEIGLNQALIKTGVEVTETDLGEWIIQLSQQKPSHMVMPAIHMTAGEVAELFTGVTGQHQPADINHLVKIARRELRKKFLEADAGIIGANIAVAENGTLVVLTNEGNGRLVATLPKTVIALVGIEKLVPSFQEAGPILKILPRNATGQTITSYVSFIRGPSDGQELHIILLDNGRMKLRDSADYRTALRCIRCGACANVCPVYQQVGGHVFGHIYSGAIGLVLTAVYHGMKIAKDLIPLCYKCQTCKAYCPAGIDIPQINIKLHQALVRQQGQSLPEKIILKGVLPNRPVFQGAVKIARSVQSLVLPGKKEICRLPDFLNVYTKSKTLPLLASRFFREQVKDWIPAFAGMTSGAGMTDKTEATIKRAIFYPGCLIDFVYPSIGEAVVKILQRFNIEVFFSPEQTCCGLPAEFSGDRASARRLALANLKTFAAAPFDYIITACPTCTIALKNFYHELFASSGGWGELSQKISRVTYDISSFLADVLGNRLTAVKQGTKITYHDACHLKNQLQMREIPRQLLTEVMGYDLVELPEQDRCCGFGGSFSIKYPEISGAILQNKVESIKKTGAVVVATDCPGCLMQIQGGLNKQNVPVRVRHTAELLLSGLT